MVKVAAVQAAPVWMDAKGTLEKTIALIEEAGAKDVKLIAFGEVWLPGYPFTIWLQPPMAAMDVVMAHRMNAITVDGPEIKGDRRGGSKRRHLGDARLRGARPRLDLLRAGADRRSRPPRHEPAQAASDPHGAHRLGRGAGHRHHRRRHAPRQDRRPVLLGEHPADQPAGGCTSSASRSTSPAGRASACSRACARPTRSRRRANLVESQSYALQGGCFVLAANSIITEDSLDKITQGRRAPAPDGVGGRRRGSGLRPRRLPPHRAHRRAHRRPCDRRRRPRADRGREGFCRSRGALLSPRRRPPRP